MAIAVAIGRSATTAGPTLQNANGRARMIKSRLNANHLIC
jgi:hypothetical protein